jgi:hypothetical protein
VSRQFHSCPRVISPTACIFCLVAEQLTHCLEGFRSVHFFINYVFSTPKVLPEAGAISPESCRRKSDN